MRRRLFAILSIVSLVLCVATSVLWVLSYTDSGVISYHGRLYAWHISYPRGERAWVSTNGEGQPSDRTELNPAVNIQVAREAYVDGMTINPPQFSALGGEFWSARLFGKGWGNTGPNGVEVPAVNYWLVVVPQWWTVTAFGFLPALAAAMAVCRALRQRRRAAKGRCPSCGYDLRATPDRCPECGAVSA
jgi:hypothetical protein